MSDYPIEGHCDERFLSVKDAFIKNFDNGDELGATFALSLDGEIVVDLWGGYANPERTEPWEENTLVQVSSSSKIVCSLCGLLLVDRGLIDLDEPIAKYWPEFAANGKADILVRHIFYHATGLPGLDGMPGWDLMGDWDEVIRRFEAQKPWWEPGTKSGYHGVSFGYLLGELVRRITGMTMTRFFRVELGDELDIDFFFGLPLDRPFKRAEIENLMEPDPTVAPEVLRKSMYYRALGYLLLEPENKKAMTSGEFLKIDFPSGNGVSNARALAKIGSLLATGGHANGKRYFSEETAALPYQEQLYSFDIVLYEKVRYGVGFGISSNELSFPWPNAFHWGGAGGSSLFMVPELGAAWAYTPSRFLSGLGTMDPRGEVLRMATIECLQVAQLS